MTPKFARALALLLLAGCAAPTEAPGAASEAIVGGMAGGLDAVVVIQNYTLGGMCSGSLIGERVVLTAKHCVQEAGAAGPVAPSAMSVGIGDNIRNLSTVLRVQSIPTTPGEYTENSRGGVNNDLIGVDVALLVLQTGVPGITPLAVRRTPPTDLAGKMITASGYGQTPSGQVGVKYTTTGTIQGVMGDLIYVGAITCEGDSGGPALVQDADTGDLVIAGTVSFGSGSCGSGFGAYNAIYNYLDLVDAALREAGSCLNNGAEVCDGADNDCNGMVDETCTPLGGSCTADSDCVGGVDCQDTVGGKICTAPCDPLRPDFGCAPDFYCASTGRDACDGWCVPLASDHQSLALDADCTRNDDCASLFCINPGDGRQRCLMPCQGDAGMCLAGEACAAVAGACGGCVPEDILHANRGLGENCTADGDCNSSHCYQDGARMYCTRDCAADSDCADGYHCRDNVCAAGQRGQIGERCATSEDCVTGTFCVARGEDHWCSRVCDDSNPCPDGFDCVAAGGAQVCAPSLGLVGDSCTGNDGCVSGLCLGAGPSMGSGPSMDGACTRACGPNAPCGAGFECRRQDDGTALCVAPPAATPPSGGCAVTGGNSNDGGRWLWVAFTAAMVWWRSRRRKNA